MSAFRPLPFQFIQRGVDLAKDDKRTAQFHEQRDQDLENYLANLHGGARVSVGIWAGSSITVVAGSGPQVITLPFVVGTNGFENFGTDGFITADGTPFDPFTDVLFGLGVATCNWNSTPSTGPGFGQASLNVDGRVLIPSASGGVSFTHTAAAVAQFLGPAAGDSLVLVSLSEVPTDIQTSTGTLGTINELSADSPSYVVYIVE